MALIECFALWLAGVTYTPKSAISHISVGDFSVSSDGELGVARITVARQASEAQAEYDLILHQFQHDRAIPLQLQGMKPRRAVLAPGGAALVVGCADGSVYLTSLLPSEGGHNPLEKHCLVLLHRMRDGIITDLIISPNGELVAAVGRQSTDLLRLPRGDVLLTWPSQEAGYKVCPGHPMLAFSGDSQRMLSLTDGDNATLWDVNDGEEVATVPMESRERRSLLEAALSHDGQLAVFVSSDGVVRVWSFSAQSDVRRWRWGSAIYRPLALSPDGRYLAVTTIVRGVYNVQLYETLSGECLAQRDSQLGALKGLTFGPGRKLYSWDASTLQEWKFDDQEQRSLSPTREWIAADIIKAGSVTAPLQPWPVTPPLPLAHWSER